MDQLFLGHQQECGAVLGKFRQGGRWENFPACVFLLVPDGLEQVLNQFLFVSRKHRDFCKLAVVELDAALRHAADFRIVCHHDDGVALAVQFGEKAHHQCFIHFIQVPRGFVGKNQVGLIDQRSRHADALLFAS